MQIKNLKTLSISNLILIILNSENRDILRKYAEVELRKRIRNVGWKYDDLLHFDDKVIKERGLDVDNYLISPNVNMQQLMETYFLYSKDTNYDSNYLLFSEKHLCNEADFTAPFFRKICKREIENIDKRIKKQNLETEKQILLAIKYMLVERQQQTKREIELVSKDTFVDILTVNDAMYQLDGTLATLHEFLFNISDEEMYKLLKSNFGNIKLAFLENLNNNLFDSDLMQYLCGLKFILNDSSKLKKQKRQLKQQVRSGYEVNYQTDAIQKKLKRIFIK